MVSIPEPHPAQAEFCEFQKSTLKPSPDSRFPIKKSPCTYPLLEPKIPPPELVVDTSLNQREIVPLSCVSKSCPMRRYNHPPHQNCMPYLLARGMVDKVAPVNRTMVSIAGHIGGIAIKGIPTRC